MMSDSTERAWWMFDVPTGARVYVPANTEAGARTVLARHAYPMAPVDTWPCVGSRWASRSDLVASTHGRGGATP